mmetsp:Transcript_110164/g.308002  ORF Transcript_110164/g.308002 Transcript_110164/m.308002 type:complete len:271 (+) Transcript_110164:523-1335(+)
MLVAKCHGLGHEGPDLRRAVDCDLIEHRAKRLLFEAKRQRLCSHSGLRDPHTLLEDGRPFRVAQSLSTCRIQVLPVRAFGAWVETTRLWRLRKRFPHEIEELPALGPVPACHQHLGRRAHVRGVEQLVCGQGLRLGQHLLPAPRRGAGHDDVWVHAAELRVHGFRGRRLHPWVALIALAPDDPVVGMVAAGDEDAVDGRAVNDQATMVGATKDEAHEAAVDERCEDLRLHDVAAHHHRIGLVDDHGVQPAERVDDVVDDLGVPRSEDACD